MGLTRGGWHVVMVTSAGEPDATFGTGGVEEVAYAENDAGAYGVAVDAQGRVVAVGGRGNGDAAVVRYLPAGTLDPSFSGDGRRVVPLGETGVDSSYDDWLLGVALAADGDLIAVGDVDRGSIGVVRLDDSGDLVEAFGDGGSIVQPIGMYAFGGSVLVQADRVVVGALIDNSLAVVAYTSDGTPDETFGGGDGIVYVGQEAFDTQETAIASTPGGGYVITGSVVRRAGEFDALVCRLDHDGVKDATFGNGGERMVQLPGQELPSDVAVRPDGRIVVTGTRYAVSKDSKAKIEVLQLHG